MKMKGRYVLVEVDAVEEKTAGGIILPVDKKRMDERLQDKGTVIGLGPLAYLDDGGPEAWEVEVGQKVMFKRTAGIVVDYPGESGRLRILNDVDILAEM